MAIRVQGTRIVITGGFAARVKSNTEVEIRTPSIQDFPDPLRVTGVEYGPASTVIVSFSDALQASTVPNVTANGLGLTNATGAVVAGAGNQHKIAFTRATHPSVGTTGSLILTTAVDAPLSSVYGNSWNQTTGLENPAQRLSIPYTVPAHTEGAVAVTLPDYSGDRPVGEVDIDLNISGIGRRIINLDADNELITITARDGSNFRNGDVVMDFGGQRPWLDLPSNINFRLPWDGTARTDHLEDDAIHSGDDGAGSDEVPSGSWVAYAISLEDLHTATGYNTIAAARDFALESSRVMDIAKGRYIYINGWVADSAYLIDGTMDNDNLVFPLQWGPLARIAFGREENGERIGGVHVQVDAAAVTAGTVALGWDPAARLRLRDFRVTFITDAEGRNVNVYGQSPTVPISMTNNASDVDITFENIPEDHNDTTFTQFRPRFGIMRTGTGRRLDVMVNNAVVVLQDQRFGVTSLRQAGGTATGRTDYAQLNITAQGGIPVETTIPDLAPSLPPRGTAPVGHLVIGGTSVSYLDLINPRLDPARVLLTRERLVNNVVSNRIEMSTDITIRGIADAAVDIVGALASAFNGTGSARSGNIVPLTATGATIRRRVWAARGVSSNNDGTAHATPTFAATDDRAVTVKIRRADLVFAERVVSVDTTIGANSVVLDVRADPAFTSTPAAAALLDQVSGSRRFGLVEDNIASGVPRKRIIVYADSTLQQLYDWLKWEYSRAALPRLGAQSARPDRHDEDLPVTLSNGRLTLAEGWQVDIVATATLSAAMATTALSLSSPYDHAADAWVATVGRVYTRDTIVTYLNRVWRCIRPAPVAQVPGSAATYWVDVTTMGTVNYLVDGQNTGTLDSTISLVDATGRTLTVVTEPGASYAYAETEVVERLYCVGANNERVIDAYIYAYGLDGTRHGSETVKLPQGVNAPFALTRDPGTNEWIVGRLRTSDSLPILERYDAVGHRRTGSAIGGFRGIVGADLMDEGRLAVVLNTNNNAQAVGIVDPRLIGASVLQVAPHIPITGISGTLEVDAVTWDGTRLYALLNRIVGNDVASVVLAINVGSANALSIDWSRSRKLPDNSAAYYGMEIIDGTLYTTDANNRLRSLGAWPPAPDASITDIDTLFASSALTQASSVALPTDTGVELFGIEWSSRRVATGTETTGTADSEGGFRVRSTHSQVEPFMVACKKRGFDARGVLVLPTVARQLMSLSENPSTSPGQDISAWSVAAETAAARPLNNIYLELNPATSIQSVLRYSDTRALKGQPVLAKAVYDAVMTTPTAMIFWLRYFLNPSTHNGGQVFSFHDAYINILQPYLRLARKAGLTNAKANAGIAFYGGDNRTLIDPDVENGGSVEVPTQVTVLNLSPAGTSAAAQTIIQDPRAINDLSNYLIPRLTAGVDALDRLEREVTLRSVAGVGDPGYAAERAALLAGTTSFTIPGETTIRWLVEPVERGEAISVPLRDHPALATVVSGSAATGWSFRAWVPDESSTYASGPLAAPTGDPLISFVGEGGTFHRASTRRDTRWVVLELSNTTTDPINVTVTGFRLTSSLAYDPIEERIADSLDEVATVTRPLSVAVNTGNLTSGPVAATALMGTVAAPRVLTPRSVGAAARGRVRVSWAETAGSPTIRLQVPVVVTTFLGSASQETLHSRTYFVEVGDTFPAFAFDALVTMPFDRIAISFNVANNNGARTFTPTIEVTYNIRELNEDLTLLYLDAPVSSRSDHDEPAAFALPANMPDGWKTDVGDSVWDRLTSAITASGSIGALLKRIRFNDSDNVRANIENPVSGNHAVDEAAIAASVWNRLTSIITTPGSIGALLKRFHFATRNGMDFVEADANVTVPDVPSVNDILDEPLAGHTTAGTLGKAIADTESDVGLVKDKTDALDFVEGTGERDLKVTLDNETVTHSGNVSIDTNALAIALANSVWGRAAGTDTRTLTALPDAIPETWTNLIRNIVWSSMTERGLTANGTLPTDMPQRWLNDIEDAMWDADEGDHVVRGSFGYNLDMRVSSRAPATGTNSPPTASAIVDAITMASMIMTLADDAKIARKFATNRQVRSGANSNLVTYDDDGTTPLRTHALKDRDDAAAGEAEVYEREGPTGTGSGT